jgi:hypothetical protein
MKLETFLDEAANLMDTYLKISKKDVKDIKDDLKKLEAAMGKKDTIGIKSASRAIESSAKRIKERMGN